MYMFLLTIGYVLKLAYYVMNHCDGQFETGLGLLMVAVQEAMDLELEP